MVRNREIKCNYGGCEKTYSSRCNLNRHIKLHHLKQTFVCPLCQKELSSKQSRDEHLYSHDKRLPYLCPYEGCGERFRQASQLSFHKKLHNFNRPILADEPTIPVVQATNCPKKLGQVFPGFPDFQLPCPWSSEKKFK